MIDRVSCGRFFVGQCHSMGIRVRAGARTAYRPEMHPRLCVALTASRRMPDTRETEMTEIRELRVAGPSRSRRLASPVQRFWQDLDVVMGHARNVDEQPYQAAGLAVSVVPVDLRR